MKQYQQIIQFQLSLWSVENKVFLDYQDLDLNCKI
jgi:hypothetical protein